MEKGGLWLTFGILFVFWMLLSTFFDPVHIALGIASSLTVAYWSHDLLIRPEDSKDMLRLFRGTARFLLYVPWLVGQILKANIDVALVVLSPKMPISPGIIKFKSELPSEVALTLLANSITLTPGTLTLDIDENKNYYIHCLAKGYGDSLLEGEMQARVGGIFR